MKKWTQGEELPNIPAIGTVVFVIYLIKAFIDTSGKHSLLLTTSSR